MTAASKWLPKEKRGIGISLVSIGGPLGVAISAPILMNMINNFGWRSAFVATGIIGVIWVAAWLWIIKEKKESIEESQSLKRNQTNMWGGRN